MNASFPRVPEAPPPTDHSHPLHYPHGHPREGRTAPLLQKKRKRGLQHLSAVTATAIKVTRAAWRVCTDQRDYLPKAPPTSAHS